MDAATSRPVKEVLIVDDEPDLLELVSFFVARFFPDAIVHSAQSPADALKILHSSHIDVILSDYRMPGMDGIQFFRASLTDAPNAAKVLMTAYTDSGLEARARREAGIQGFLRKPFAPAQLRAMLEPFLAGA